MFNVRLIILSDENSAKNILPIIFRKKDGSAQPIEQPIDNIDKTRKNKKKRKQLGIRLARNIIIIVEVDLIENIEAIR